MQPELRGREIFKDQPSYLVHTHLINLHIQLCDFLKLLFCYSSIRVDDINYSSHLASSQISSWEINMKFIRPTPSPSCTPVPAPHLTRGQRSPICYAGEPLTSPETRG